MSYGLVANVEALAGIWTVNGLFLDVTACEDATNPSLTQVEAWIEQMSSVVDLAIATEGMATPLTDTTAVAAVSAIIEGVVADLCHAANRTGRFFTKTSIENGVSPVRAVTKELNDWVANNAVGLRTLGVTTVADAVGEHTASFDIL